MFCNLNKQFMNKKILVLLPKHLRCLNKQSSSETSSSSKTDPKVSDTKGGNPKDIDYLGIFDINHKEISGLYETSDDQNNVFEKYSDLVDSRGAKMNDQSYLVTSFGRVRLDSNNKPRFHGQYDPDNSRPKFSLDEFEDRLKNSTNTEQTDDTNQSQSENSTNNENNIFEEQYFDQSSDGSKRSDILEDNSSSVDSQTSEIGYIDRQYFAKNANIEPLFKSKIDFKFNQQFNEFLHEKSSELESIQRIRFNEGVRKINQEFRPIETDNKADKSIIKELSLKSPLKSELFFQNFDLNIGSNEESNEESAEEEFDEEIRMKIEEQKDITLETVESTADKYKKTPRTGAEYLEDLRRGKESPIYPKVFTDLKSNLKGDKLDSKGYRILSGQVLDYTKMTNEDIIRLLMDSILFNDADILAINKPYGMSIHTKESNSVPVLTEYLKKIAENVKTEKLYTVHRLDKDTTGALLLAKSQEKAKQLNRMFVEHLIVKRYLCITRGVPEQPEGIIDIPIEIGKCGDRERMVLRPEALEEYKRVTKSSKSAKRAVTQYKVVSESRNAALIEVWPKTGVRHQIRVHLGFGLRCPILGDHKYSHLDKMVPQKLTNDMLLALNVRQAKVRHIPLHLHAMQYCLPAIGAEGRNIFINAPLPHHFHKNMSQLRLRQ